MSNRKTCNKCNQPIVTPEDVARHDAEFEHRDRECPAQMGRRGRKRCWCESMCWSGELRSKFCPHASAWRFVTAGTENR